MTILQKPSDREGFIFEVIRIILLNDGNMNKQKLQRVLLGCGVYVKKPLLDEILKTMLEKKLIDPNPKVQKPKIITHI